MFLSFDVVLSVFFVQLSLIQLFDVIKRGVMSYFTMSPAQDCLSDVYKRKLNTAAPLPD